MRRAADETRPRSLEHDEYDDGDTSRRNFAYVKETYFDMVGKTLEVCDLEKFEDRQLLAMFVSSYFLKVVDFKQGMDVERKTYHQATAMHLILEAGECETADDFFLVLRRFLETVERLRYDEPRDAIVDIESEI